MTHSLVKETQHGSLRGGWADATHDIQVFRGIPFAKPPVGDLRWRPPAPLSSWTGTRSAETFADACYQAFSEDAFVWSRGEFERSEGLPLLERLGSGGANRILACHGVVPRWGSYRRLRSCAVVRRH
jgi:hypothetical protein